MSMRFHHMGIAVKDINEAASRYGNMLGLTPWDSGIIEDSENGVRLLSLPTAGTFIELIQPVAENRFARFLRERGEGLFHICFFSEDFDEEVSKWKDKGLTVEEEMAHSFPGQPFRLAWLPPEPNRGFWIELADAAAAPKH